MWSSVLFLILVLSFVVALIGARRRMSVWVVVLLYALLAVLFCFVSQLAGVKTYGVQISSDVIAVLCAAMFFFGGRKQQV